MERTCEAIVEKMNESPDSLFTVEEIKRIASLPENSPFTVEDILEKLTVTGAIEKSGDWIALK